MKFFVEGGDIFRFLINLIRSPLVNIVIGAAKCSRDLLSFLCFFLLDVNMNTLACDHVNNFRLCNGRNVFV